MTPEEQAAVEVAYGLLWLTATSDSKVHKARQSLLSILDFEAKKRGIQAAMVIKNDVRTAERKGSSQ